MTVFTFHNIWYFILILNVVTGGQLGFYYKEHEILPPLPGKANFPLLPFNYYSKDLGVGVLRGWASPGQNCFVLGLSS